jgi:hypothetical protein
MEVNSNEKRTALNLHAATLLQIDDNTYVPPKIITSLGMGNSLEG